MLDGCWRGLQRHSSPIHCASVQDAEHFTPDQVIGSYFVDSKFLISTFLRSRDYTIIIQFQPDEKLIINKWGTNCGKFSLKTSVFMPRATLLTEDSSTSDRGSIEQALWGLSMQTVHWHVRTNFVPQWKNAVFLCNRGLFKTVFDQYHCMALKEQLNLSDY